VSWVIEELNSHKHILQIRLAICAAVKSACSKAEAAPTEV